MTLLYIFILRYFISHIYAPTVFKPSLWAGGVHRIRLVNQGFGLTQLVWGHRGAQDLNK